MTLTWISCLIAASGLFIAFVSSKRPRVAFAELGAMSEQWLAEQRANDRPY
jgi:hypothetical protein